ncbi:MAG: TIGR02710 family CRISPR-associated protein [Candidatus Diapherotrites archaeon]|nr:TIGR02710 family CRISPR-associated protein [Candidatus Diapherotrites archaeon]
MPNQDKTKIERVLIATVGYTEEPLQYSIVEHEPQGLLLLASQDSLETAASVRRAFSDLRSQILVIEDAEDLIEAFRAARKAYARAKQWEAKVVIADLSGGTKPMTAGTALALSGLGVTFSYVGGLERDQRGRVVTGSERLRLLEDPTERFHQLELRAFKNAWNYRRMGAAADSLKQILQRESLLSPSEKRYYSHLLLVVQGLDAWDRFHHSDALQSMERGLPVALAIAEAWHHGSKVRVLSGLDAQLDNLKKIVEKAGYPTYALLSDLLANADRRAEAGQYDDAVARLYRAMELAAEADLYHRTGIVLRKSESWPDNLKHLLQERTEQLFGLQSVLDLIFDVDVQLGNRGTLAQKLRAQKVQMGDILRKRNQSILAHGTEPVDRDSYLSFRQVFTDLGLEAAPAWPKW